MLGVPILHVSLSYMTMAGICLIHRFNFTHAQLQLIVLQCYKCDLLSSKYPQISQENQNKNINLQ